MFIPLNLLLFAHSLFIFIARGLFNCFARILLITLISINFAIRIYLTTILITTMLPLRNHACTINCNINRNVCSIFIFCSAFLLICSKIYRFFRNHKKIIIVSIIIFLLCHNLFHHSDGHSCCCACAFIH